MACIFLTDEDKRHLMAEIKKMSGGTISDEQIAAAVEAYLAENPIQGGELTADSITEALGYFPADQMAVEAVTMITDSLAMEVSAIPSNYALKSEIPTVPVQSVNGKTGAVQLSAADVGARPSTWTPSASEVGADKSGTADSKVSAHNTSNASHNDIRLLISGLASRLDALADSDDTTLDQLSEIVAYIKANKSLIEGITTSKVNVADIVNNLTSNVTNKPLSAAQGVALKALIDAIKIPTTLPASDVYSWAKAATKPSYTKTEVGLGNVDNVKQYSASNPPPYPVQSVNGKTGAVSLSASDVGAASAKTVSQLSSDLADKVSKNGITLGLFTDGKYYIFVDGSPVGTGFELSGNSGDVFGYVDENNNIVLNGNLADGTYSIKYELEDEDGNAKTVDIGDLEVDTNVYYTVTNSLTNCTTSNSATEAVKGGSYSATITANSGFELKSVTVTMGGSPVSVSGGSINIANVTGNIVITAVAEEVQTAEPTNFFKASPTVNTTATASQDAVVLGGRLGSDNGYRADGGPDVILTNYIPVQAGDEVKITNLAFNNLNSAMYKSDKTVIGVFQSTNTAYVTNVATSGNTQTFKIAHANAGYVRISGKPSVVKNSSGTTADVRYDLTTIVINVKRNGEWL